MKTLQVAVLVGLAALVLASPNIVHRAGNNAVTTTTLYSTSYFTVTKCASHVNDCPTEATTVYTSVVPVNSTTTICLVTSGPSGIPDQTSLSRNATLTPSVPGIPGQGSSSDPGSLTSFTTLASNISSPYSPTGQYNTNVDGTLTSPGMTSSSGYGTTPASTGPSLVSSAPSVGYSNTNTDGMLTSSRLYSSGYSSPSNSSLSSSVVTEPEATLFPSSSVPSSPGSGNATVPGQSPSHTAPEGSGNATVPGQSPSYTAPESTTTTHVTSFTTLPSTIGVTLSGGYNSSATPTITDVFNTLTSVGTGVSGGPSGSASGFPLASGDNNSVAVPKPTWSPIPNNEGQSVMGTSKSSIVAIIVALAFAHFA